MTDSDDATVSRNSASGDATESRIEEKRFRGWRLLGVCALVVVVIAVISALVDWWVIGPLEGRVF